MLILESLEVPALEDVLLLFCIQLVLDLLVLVSKVVNGLFVFFLFFSVLFDRALLFFDFLLHVFLLSIEKLRVSFELSLFLGQFLDLVLLLLNFFLFLHQIGLEFQDFLVEVRVSVLKILVLLLLHLDFLLEILLGSHQLVDGVVLA